MENISALFVRRDSIYKQLGVDSWDFDRDALKWPGGNAIIAHPPCRSWGKLKAFARPRPGEKWTAIWSVLQIRRHGGVLEHPRASYLWRVMGLPVGNQVDKWGGYTVCVNQSWWGHKAEKKTLLYICGCPRQELPEMPITFNAIEYVVSTSRPNKSKLPEIPKTEREATPPEFAKWLIQVAQKCNTKTHELLSR